MIGLKKHQAGDLVFAHYDYLYILLSVTIPLVWLVLQARGC